MANLGEAFVQIIADTSRFVGSATAGIKKGMSEVEDVVESSLQDIATSDAIDAIGDNLSDSVSSATSDMSDSFDDAGSEIESSLDSVGSVASNVFDGVASDAQTGGAAAASALEDELGAAAENVRGMFDGVFESIGDNMGKFSVAAVGAGVGAEAFARKNQDLEVVLGRVARGMDLPEESLRQLAAATQDSTRPLEDVLALFEIAQQRGADGADSLENYAMFWDMVGDATGENAVSLGKAGTALAALGIGLGEEEKALDAFGFIATQTTTEVGEFLNFTGLLAAELGDLGLSVDDTAALLGAMETELGLSGRAARTQFRKGISAADGDMGLLLETLGLSEEQFEHFQGQVVGSGDALVANAEAFLETRTPVQRFQASLDSLIFRFPQLNEAASLIAAPLAGLAPLLLGANAASDLLRKGIGSKMVGVLKAATIGFKKLAIAIFANPIFLIGAVIVGLIVIFFKFRDEIMGAIKTAFEFVTNIVRSFIDWITDALQRFGQFFTDQFERLTDAVKQVWERFRDMIVNVFTNLRDRVVGIVTMFRDNIVGNFNRVRDGVVAGVEFLRDKFIGAIQALADGVKRPFNMVIGFYNALIGGAEAMLNAVGGALGRIPSFTVPSWVPRFGGNTFSVPSFGPLSLPRIPQLADGGIVQSDTLARIGEAGREAVVPLDRESDPLGIARLLRESQPSRQVTVNVYGESRPLDEDRLVTLLRRSELLEGVRS